MPEQTAPAFQGTVHANIITEGPASRYGKAATALLALVAAVTAVLHGDHSIETIMAGGGAVVVLITYMGGRYAQAVALLRDARTVVAPAMVTTTETGSDAR